VSDPGTPDFLPSIAHLLKRAGALERVTGIDVQAVSRLPVFQSRNWRRAIAEFLRPRVRFHNHKAAYLVAARERFRPGGRWALKATLSAFPSPEAAREWFVREVHGFSMKEAAHLLRNIGFSDRLAILDRHVLRNLARHGVVRSIPKSLTTRRYLEIEARWRAFADAVGIPLAELDLLFFSRGAGAILK